MGISVTLDRVATWTRQVWVFDNDDLRTPFRLAAVFECGRVVKLQEPAPTELQPLLHDRLRSHPVSTLLAADSAKIQSPVAYRQIFPLLLKAGRQ
jgi:hypothetical protein